MYNDIARIILNYNDEKNKKDNGVLLFSTGDNGNEPIVFQQCVGDSTSAFKAAKT
jgi:hypothetical protein